MTEKKNTTPVESDDEDDDYCPTKNDNETKSDESDEDSEEETHVEETPANDSNIKPYDESKTSELWKNFTSSNSSNKSSTTTDVKTEKKIFDYAGEKVSVSVPTNSSLKRPVASSNSVLDRLGIGKKQKLSTLEKSRLDWNAHKDSESLHEDLDSHRRGKNSYVEKKAFLERTELREHDHFLTNVKKK